MQFKIYENCLFLEFPINISDPMGPKQMKPWTGKNTNKGVCVEQLSFMFTIGKI